MAHCKEEAALLAQRIVDLSRETTLDVIAYLAGVETPLFELDRTNFVIVCDTVASFITQGNNAAMAELYAMIKRLQCGCEAHTN